MDRSDGFPPRFACAKNLLRSVPHFRCNRTGNNKGHYPVRMFVRRRTLSGWVHDLNQRELPFRITRERLLDNNAS